jgi:membrane protein DedA with SNARE-associated domain
VAAFWDQWGVFAYAVAAIWAFFEGETFVLAAAAVGATVGGVDPWFLMLSVWGGSFAGDQTWFTLGRRFGPRVLRRFPSAERKAEMAAGLLERHGTFFVLFYRFLYGIRNIAAAACGLAGMPRRRFAALNFAGAGIWAGSFVAAGWFVGALLGAETVGYLIASAALVILLVLAIRFRRRRRAATVLPGAAFVAPAPLPAHAAARRPAVKTDAGV